MSKMKSAGAVWDRISSDLKHKELMPLKLLFFIHASTILVLYPYLTIHMRELGINVEETAIMNAVTPVIAIVMPPLAGMFADRIGNFRVLLSFFSALGGVSSLLLLLVPVGRISLPMPARLPVALGCGEIHPNAISPLQLTLIPDPPCVPLTNMNQSWSLALEACGLVCSTPNPSLIDEMLQAPVYRVDVGLEGRKDEFWYTPRRPDPYSDWFQSDDPRNIPINPPNYYNMTIRKMSSDHVFFPTPTMYNVTCLRDTCYFMAGDVNFRNATRYTTNNFFNKNFTFHRVNISQEETIATFYSEDNDEHSISKRESNFTTSIPEFMSPMYEIRLNNSSLRCEDPLSLRELSVGIPTLQRTSLKMCRPLCLASVPRDAFCKSARRTHEYNPSLTFWSYLAVRVVIGVIGGTAFAMFEGAVIATLREYRADYGLQRIYATIGGMISSPLAGLLIDYASRGKEYTDFRPAFYLYAFLKVLGGLLMLTIRLDFKAPAPGVVKHLLHVLKNIEIIALLLACFLLGTAWGYLESFLFWLLQDLGASRSLMGLTITVGGLAGLPLLALSGPIIDAIGHANVICIGFLVYSIRLIGYSVLYDPWMCLLFEAMEGVTSSLTFTAIVTYGARLSNASTDSSVQGMLGGIYYGVGKGAGSLIGGFLIKNIGTRETYQLFAMASAGVGVLYYLFHKFVTTKRPKRRVNDIMSPTNPEIKMDKIPENNKPPLDVEAVKIDDSKGKSNEAFEDSEKSSQEKIPKIEEDIEKKVPLESVNEER